MPSVATFQISQWVVQRVWETASNKTSGRWKPWYEIPSVSWVMEPVGSNIKDSSELISGEELRSSIDDINIKNSAWDPIEGSLMEREEMVECAVQPKLCDCLV